MPTLTRSPLAARPARVSRHSAPLAFLREISPQLRKAQLTHIARTTIDLDRARRQHRNYADVLRRLGYATRFLPPLPAAPDGVFVEDIAIALDEVIIVTRPGVPSRQGEPKALAESLANLRPVVALADHEYLEGGDVLRIGRTLFIGRSQRTSVDGFVRVREIVEPFGYRVRMVPVTGCLHLKTACTFVPPRFVLANPAWVDRTVFSDYEFIPVAPEEPFAANTLTLGRVTLVSAAYPQTERRLNKLGVTTRRIEISELHKAEAGLTCLSLLVPPVTAAKRR